MEVLDPFVPFVIELHDIHAHDGELGRVEAVFDVFGIRQLYELLVVVEIYGAPELIVNSGDQSLISSTPSNLVHTLGRVFQALLIQGTRAVILVFWHDDEVLPAKGSQSVDHFLLRLVDILVTALVRRSKIDAENARDLFETALL